MNEYNKTETDSYIYIYKERKLAVTSGERSGKEEQDRGRQLRDTNYYLQNK